MTNPKVLLLDEPLSALDPGFREEVRDSLKDLHRSSGTTFIMVTHDFLDALFLAERAALINEGRIVQSGETVDLFRRPNCLFAAQFVGMKNILRASFSGSKARVGNLTIDLERTVQGNKQYICVRPEDVLISREPAPINGSLIFKGIVNRVTDHGLYWWISVETGEIRLQAAMPRSSQLNSDPRGWQEVYVHLNTSLLHVF